MAPASQWPQYLDDATLVILAVSRWHCHGIWLSADYLWPWRATRVLRCFPPLVSTACHSKSAAALQNVLLFTGVITGAHTNQQGYLGSLSDGCVGFSHMLQAPVHVLGHLAVIAMGRSGFVIEHDQAMVPRTNFTI